MTEEACARELQEILDGLSTNREQAIDHYKRRITPFIRTFSSETLEGLQPRTEIEQMAIAPIKLGALFIKNKHEEVNRFVNDQMMHHLLGKTRVYDYFMSMILRFYYLSRKHEKQDNSMLFSLLECNKELGNEDTVSVLTNCILDMLISNKIFQRIENPMSSSPEQARYSYYNGIIAMVEGGYEEALQCFHTSAILSSGKQFNVVIEKCIIVCMLLLSDYSIPYSYNSRLKAYFGLITAVKQADLPKFEEELEKNREEFMNEGLYFVIRRLAQNVVQEGIRKVSLVYSRISFSDITGLLGMSEEDVGFLVQKTILQGFMKGEVVGNVLHSIKEEGMNNNIGLSIRDCIDLTRAVQEHMKYPSIRPLCYEKVMEAYEE
jgi:26S proteasome regulatory subunit N3